jgi:hypothetical protein
VVKPERVRDTGKVFLEEGPETSPTTTPV